MGLISRKLFFIENSYVFDHLYFTQCLPSFSSIDHLLCLCARFFILFNLNIDEVFLIDPSANVFVFGDFSIHHKDWLTYSGGADRSGELCYIFSISYDLTELVNFPTWIPDCDSHSPALLDLFISSDAIICSTMAFPPFVNSDNFVVSVSIDFPSYSQHDALFHHIAYDYSCADGMIFVII